MPLPLLFLFFCAVADVTVVSTADVAVVVVFAAAAVIAADVLFLFSPAFDTFIAVTVIVTFPGSCYISFKRSYSMGLF